MNERHESTNASKERPVRTTDSAAVLLLSELSNDAKAEKILRYPINNQFRFRP